MIIEGVILANEVTAIPRGSLIAEIVYDEALRYAERVERLLALGCERCGQRATTIFVMESDIDRTPRIWCDEHRPRLRW